MGIGFLLGLVSSATFGLIPLFSLPLLHSGLTPETTLFYRFAIAALSLGVILTLRRERFALRGIDFCKLATLSLMYMLAALLLFRAFHHLPSGVAATLQFLYPVMVMLIMVCFFGERFVWTTALAIALAVGGVAILSSGGGAEGRGLSFLGVGMMLLSALCNALYIVGL
ncbi:MAG: DMT family transporter [Desulfovibrionaceae bacterium]|nr:DMT family transporter [Desulfovibrionaceae bacterium]